LTATHEQLVNNNSRESLNDNDPSKRQFSCANAHDIYVILDMNVGTLSFVVNSKYLGIAFRGLRGRTVFPMVSAVWGHCEVTMKYMNGIPNEPLSLEHQLRHRIRGLAENGCTTNSDMDMHVSLTSAEYHCADCCRQFHIENAVSQLPLPKRVQQFLLYHDVR
jgi:hypothetical protein